jgi:hypothetical protein
MANGRAFVAGHARRRLENLDGMEGRCRKDDLETGEDQLGDALGAGIVLEPGLLVEKVMVEVLEHSSQGSLQFAEIEEHPALVEAPAPRPDANPIIMAMEPFTLALVVSEKMCGRELRLDPY